MKKRYLIMMIIFTIMVFSLTIISARAEQIWHPSLLEISDLEAALQGYNDRLRRAEDLTNIGHWEFHLSDNTVIVSEGAQKVYGLVGDTWTIPEVQTIPLPEYRDMLDQALLGLITHGDVYDVEFRIQRPNDGQIVDIRSIAEYNPDSNVVFGTLMDTTEYNQMVGAVKHTRDIIIASILLLLIVSGVSIVILLRLLKMRKLTELQLKQTLGLQQEQERQLRNVMDNIPGMVFRCKHDQSWTIVFVSSGAMDLLGYKPDELVDNAKITFNDLILPDYRDYVQSVWETAIKNREPVTVEYQIRIASGDIKWVYEQGCGVYDDSGELLFLEGLVIDITAQKSAEEAARKREQDLEVTLQSIGDAVIATDTKGYITRMNTVAANLTGWSMQEAIGRPLTQVFTIINSVTRAQAANPVAEVLKHGRIVGLANHTSLMARDGTEYQIADSAAPILNQSGSIQGVILVFHDVTEMYQQRETLAQSEKQFRKLFAHSVNAIAIHQMVFAANGEPSDYIFLQANTAFEQHTDLHVADIIGKPVTHVQPGIEDTGLIEIYGQVVLTGKPISFEHYVALNQRFYYIRAYPMDRNQFAVVFEDISKRKTMEKALRKNEKLLKDIQHLTKVGGWEWDVSKQNMTCTDEFYTLHGIKPGEIEPGSTEHMEKSFACYEPTRRPEMLKAFQRCLEHGEEYDMELPFTTVTGSARWVRIAAYAVKNNAGNVEKVIGNILDITEQKQAQLELENSEKRFRQLVELAPDAIFVQTEGKFRYVNQAAIDLFGASAEEELIDHPVMDRFHPDYRKKAAERLQQLYERKKSVPRIEAVYLKIDGSPVSVEVAAVPIVYHGSNAALVYAQDITTRKQVETRLQYLTYHDPVTDLYNRRFLEEEIQRLDTENQLPLSIIMADVNGLKIVNDSLGHHQGDKLLHIVANTLLSTCRPDDIVARWGGDEFLILLPKTSKDQVHQICAVIESTCKQQKEDPIAISLAVGYATKERAEQHINGVVKQAEDNMYHRKMNTASSNKSALVASLQRALGEKSYETEHHARKLQAMALSLGKKMGLSQSKLDEASLLALLHDIGKVGISESILNKPGPLTEDQREIIKTHSEIGYRIAAASPDLAFIAQGILSHHEHWDGAGYPRGLQQEEIPLTARIIAVVDAYEAMTSDRPYRKRMAPAKALAEIQAHSGSQFDPQIASHFIEMLQEKEAATTQDMS